MRGADHQDQLGHPVAYQHLASLPELAVVGDAWPLPAPPGAKRLCLCDFTYSMGDARPQGNPRRGLRPPPAPATWVFGTGQAIVPLSRLSASACSRPLLDTALPPSGVRLPDRSVN